MENGVNNDVGQDNRGFIKDPFKENVQINEKLDDRTHFEGHQPATTSEKRDSNFDKDETDLSCGIWRFRTKVFGRKFSNLYMFSILVALSTLFTLMIQTIFQIQITSIMTEYKINSKEAGMFNMASKIGGVCTVLFAGHFAKKVHIPMVVGSAGVIQGIALMVPAFIQFSHPYTLQDLGSVTTHSNITNKTTTTNLENMKYMCILDESRWNLTNNDTQHTVAPHVVPHVESNRFAYNIIVIVQVIKGITDSFHAGFLPTLYVDDNVIDKTKMGIFFGIQSVITELAQPLGQQINGFISKIPVDLKYTEMDPKDPRFVAAWWLAFLVFGAGCVIFSIPVMLFPKRLLSQREQEAALRKALVSFTIGDGVASATEDSNEKNPNNLNGLTITEKGASPTPGRKNGRLSLAPRISTGSGFLDTTSHSNSRRSSLVPPLHGPTERKISIDGRMIFEQPIKVKASVDGGKSIQGPSNLKDLIKDFPRAFFRVFSRPVFILIIIDIFVASIPMAGLYMFRNLYITRQYNVSTADAATLTAVTQIVGQIVGIIISGFLASRVKTKTGYVYIIICTYLVSLVVTPFFIIYGCKNEKIYGFNGDFGMPVNLTEGCDCSGAQRLIACGDDGNNYLSPCHASCVDSVGKMFTQCVGLGGYNQTMKLTPGLCDSDCHSNYLLYVFLHAVQILMSSMATIPRRLMILRMVDPTDRGFATSVFAFCSILVGIPSPNVFGGAIDSTCLIWEGELCLLYDRDKIRYLISGTDIGVSVFIQFSVMLTTFFFKREEKQLKKKMLEEGNTKAEPSITVVKL